MDTSISATRNSDETFDILNNGLVLHTFLAREVLPKYLDSYMTEDKRNDVLRQLKICDKVTVDVLSFGKFEQV